MDELSRTFGRAIDSNERRIEKRRLAVFLAIGAALFVLAVVGAAFVPLRWPNLVRRAGHSVFFVPLGYWLTIRMLRGDRIAAPSVPAFDPRLIARTSLIWFLGGVALIIAISVVFMWLFGLHWVVNPSVGAGALLLMLLDIALIAAAEEIAFRGYALWRLIRLIGMWPAQIVIALAFALSHFTLGGYSILPALIGTVLGSLLFGIVFVRTRGLAAPIALHVGWNIAQHFLLSPLEPSAAILRPTFLHPTSTYEYISMLLIIGSAMAIAAAGIYRRSRASFGALTSAT